MTDEESRVVPFGIARLFALDALERASAKDYIDWAMEALTDGASEPCIAILAGMDKGTTYFEAKEYFYQALFELELEEPETDSKLDLYVESAAKEILAGNLNYNELLRFACDFHLSRNAHKSKYDLLNLYLLNYAIEEFDSGDECWIYYYEGLDTVNPARSVERECKIILGIEKPEPNPRFLEKKKSSKTPSGLEPTDLRNRITGLAIEPAYRFTPLGIVIALLIGIALIMAMQWVLGR